MGDWGPSHQHRRPPRSHRWRAIALAVGGSWLLLVLAVYRHQHPGGGSSLAWALRTLLGVAFAGLALRWLLSLVASGRIRLRRPAPPLAERVGQQLARGRDPAAAVREQSRLQGAGAFLGLGPGGRWVSADREHAVMVLGPPRSGKTSSIVIPSLLACPGAAVCTSTKDDVLRATARARAGAGELWLFDPSGDAELAFGARRLCWSPVPGSRNWDGALLMARAMAACSSVGRGTSHEHHWTERSAALLAPLLHAAALSGRSIVDVLRWVLRHDLNDAALVLEDRGVAVANDVLVGIAQTDERERSSIFSAAAGILSAYNSDAARGAASHPNFDPVAFVSSSDTVYVTAPAHRQAMVAPLVVGLLEEIRHAAYERARVGHDLLLPVFMCLDEVANIAPIHDLPSLVSEAGGQGLHVLACLQDLSQVRGRWGEQAADGFLSLFQTKVVLSGIADPRTLEAISVALGEYDRQLVAHSLQLSRTGLMGPATKSESVTYSTQRQRTLPPGEIANLPHEHALLLRGVKWGLLRLTPWHATTPWPAVAGVSRAPVGAPVGRPPAVRARPLLSHPVRPRRIRRCIHARNTAIS